MARAMLNYNFQNDGPVKEDKIQEGEGIVTEKADDFIPNMPVVEPTVDPMVNQAAASAQAPVQPMSAPVQPQAPYQPMSAPIRPAPPARPAAPIFRPAAPQPAVSDDSYQAVKRRGGRRSGGDSMESQAAEMKMDPEPENKYANSFPAWDLMPPQVLIRRVTRKK